MKPCEPMEEQTNRMLPMWSSCRYETALPIIFATCNLRVSYYGHSCLIVLFASLSLTDCPRFGNRLANRSNRVEATTNTRSAERETSLSSPEVSEKTARSDRLIFMIARPEMTSAFRYV